MKSRAYFNSLEEFCKNSLNFELVDSFLYTGDTALRRVILDITKGELAEKDIDILIYSFLLLESLSGRRARLATFQERGLREWQRAQKRKLKRKGIRSKSMKLDPRTQVVEGQFIFKVTVTLRETMMYDFIQLFLLECRDWVDLVHSNEKLPGQFFIRVSSEQFKSFDRLRDISHLVGVLITSDNNRKVGLPLLGFILQRIGFILEK